MPSALICWIISKICLTMRGASPKEGSSSRSSLGRHISARPDRQHLLFTAAETATALFLPFSEHREELEHFVDIFSDTLLIVSRVGTKFEVFEDSHIREDEPSLWHLRDAECDAIFRRGLCYVVILKIDTAFNGCIDTGGRHQGRRFSGTVCTDQADHLAVVNDDGDAPDGSDAAVVGVNVSEFKHGFLVVVSTHTKLT